MAKGSRKRRRQARGPAEDEVTPARELELFGPDPLAVRLRAMVGGFIEDLVAGELDEALRAGWYERTAPEGEGARLGYRHTSRRRELTTSLGPTTIRVQRARLFDEDGAPSGEWRSTLEPIRAPVQTGEVSWMKVPHGERRSEPLRLRVMHSRSQGRR